MDESGIDALRRDLAAALQSLIQTTERFAGQVERLVILEERNAYVNHRLDEFRVNVGVSLSEHKDRHEKDKAALQSQLDEHESRLDDQNATIIRHSTIQAVVSAVAMIVIPALLAWWMT